MRKGGRIDLIISIVLAIAIWAYVVGVVDPSTQEKITVPVTYANTEELSNQGLEVVSPSKPEVTVVVRGDRSDVKKIEADDIMATLDVSNLKEGKNDVKVSVSVPATVTYVRTDNDEIEVKTQKADSGKKQDK